MSNMIQMPTETPMENWMDYTTNHEQDSDSKYFDEAAASRVYPAHTNPETQEVLVLGRTRIEFYGEHFPVSKPEPGIMLRGTY